MRCDCSHVILSYVVSLSRLLLGFFTMYTKKTNHALTAKKKKKKNETLLTILALVSPLPVQQGVGKRKSRATFMNYHSPLSKAISMNGKLVHYIPA